MARHNNKVLRMPTKNYRKANSDEVFMVGFHVSRDFSPISWLIRKIKKLPFSEISVKFRDKKMKQAKVFHTEGINVCYSGENNFDKNNKTVSEFPIQVNAEFYKEFLNECFKHANVKHGFLRQIFKPKEYFNILEWLTIAIQEKKPDWTLKDPKEVKAKDIFEHFLKLMSVNN